MKKLCCALRVLVAHAINFSFSVKKGGSEKHSLLMTSITKYNKSLILLQLAVQVSFSTSRTTLVTTTNATPGLQISRKVVA